jgi:hypothetical protein
MNQNIKDSLEQAARVIAGLVNLETPVTASLEIVVGMDGVAAPKYRISLGDVCDRGRWKWICVWGDSAEECADKAAVASAAQFDKRAMEIADLTKRAMELGLVVTAAEGAK